MGEADWAERKAGRITVGKGVLIVPFRIIHITPTFDEGMGPRQVSAGIKKERGTLMFKPKYRNLVIIGNGFDRWQGLPTAYDEFRKYYSAHLDETMNDLGIHSKTISEPDGTTKTVTPVELVYGDPFDPQKLPSEFFWSFETSLDKMDDQQLILYFGRTKKGIDQLQETVEQAQTILCHLFSGWILSLDITEADSKYQFKDDCFFVNFNYTNTLEKRFKVTKSSIYHIHGDAEHPDSIIFGHATHPETAFTELTEQHFIKPLIPGHGLPRLKALYAIEDALYRTDKHVADNINHMCAAFMDANLHIEDIENIYVLGHSFGDPDAEYFDYIDKTTRCGCDFEALSAAGKMVEDDFMQLLMLGIPGTEELLYPMIQLNIRYAAHHRERELKKSSIPFPKAEKLAEQLLGPEKPYDSHDAYEEKRAVNRRFLFEQAGRTQYFLKEIAQKYGDSEFPDGIHSVLGLAEYLDGGHTQRLRNAQWHISYRTPEDKVQIKRIMKQIGLKRYHLYDSIDKCLQTYVNDHG